jgi:hypothetical protein
MKVVQGGNVWVGIAGEGYDVERLEKTHTSVAWVSLGDGTTIIKSGISEDGGDHRHLNHLRGHLPETKPYDLALRITKDGNRPQVQFNGGSVWHHFGPHMGALKAGPWLPYLKLHHGDDHFSDLCVDHPKPTQSPPCAPVSKIAVAETSGHGERAAGAGADPAAAVKHWCLHDDCLLEAEEPYRSKEELDQHHRSEHGGEAPAGHAVLVEGEQVSAEDNR